MALLLRRDLKTVKAKFGQGYSIRPSLLQTAPPPRAPPGAAFYRPRISRPPLISGGRLGYCEWYGDIFVSRAQSIVEQRITLYHEWVHSILKPKFVPLRQLRMNLTASGYWRVAFLRYLEETMAEAYGQLRVRGIAAMFKAVSFPIRENYVTISELFGEGAYLGTIIIGGSVFKVSWSSSPPFYPTVQ